MRLRYTSTTTDPRVFRETYMAGWFNCPPLVFPELPATTYTVPSCDAGPGVAPTMAEKIFRAFERGDDRLSRATSGTGLGLSLVRGVAQAHGGRAWVEPLEPGARFVVQWPLEGRARS